jgi:cytochrome c biogenesis protein CcmG, thiol:disulfide interchange protein DsbE
VITGRLKLIGQVIAATVVVALLGLFAWKLAADDSGVAADLAAGKVSPAPDFELASLADPSRSISLSGYRGKAVVVNFWASWCVPCREESPFLESVYQRYRARGLVVLGVDVKDFNTDARRFVKRFKMTYPVVTDGRGKTVGRWGVQRFPETYFVDRKGRLVGERIQGGVDLERNREAFDRGVASALGDPR